MPQIFQVLKCYKCSVFQVHQTRKDNKWICKICGEKQSVKRHYGLGTGKECRIHVQKLNKMRGEKEDMLAKTVDSEDSECGENIENDNTNNIGDEVCVSDNVSKDSKWSVYIDNPEHSSGTNEPLYYYNKELDLEVPQKRKINSKFKQSKHFKKSIDNEEYSKVDTYNCLNNEIDWNERHTIYTGDNNIQKFDSRVLTDYNDTNVATQIKNKVKCKKDIPNFLSEKVNKESKWMQFIDTKEILDENDDNNTEKNSSKHPLFSLCDDSEIDTILDI